MDAKPHIKIRVHDEDLTNGALGIINILRPHWQIEDIAFQLLTDGITNKLIKCYRKSIDNNDVVLVRIYGPKTELLIDRKAEAKNILILNKANLAPELYATFDNGLVYEYTPGVTLTPDTVSQPKFYRLIAKNLALLHKVHVDEKNSNPHPILWEKLNTFLELVPIKFSQRKKDTRYHELFGGDKSKITKELDTLRPLLQKTTNSPVVFAHNDLLLGNIIYNDRNETVTFIDYEYAALNYQAFDIGNHFAEFVGLDNLDYENCYPSEKLQLNWLREYLKEYQGEFSEQELRCLYVDVNKFALVSHIFWGLWALIQAEYSTIDFDYIEYAASRFNEYYTRKDQFLKL